MAHEVDLKRVVRLPLAAADTLPHLQISPIGIIPKRNRPKKWRLIVDLSSPDGQSVNDGMDRAQCSIKYASIDDVVQLIRGLGEGSLLAKLDLKDAYRIVPVHPDDRPLLGMRWRESLYVDTVLPFGLRSAPKIFSALADGMIWIMHLQGVDPSIHYLDDFLLFGPPASSACAESLATALSVCDRLGVPIAGGKTEGPATSLTFLGIQIDMRAMQLSLPREKLHDLKGRLNHWMQSGELSTPRRSGKKRDLLSLIGVLQHAATVVKPGRTFVRSLIDASTTVKSLEHYIHLNAHARADVMWWHLFSQSWNGTSLLPSAEPTQVTYSDASGSWGCGASCQDQWFQLQWPIAWASTHISAKELAPIVIALAVWGAGWAGQRICCYSDNMAVVYAINRGSAKDPQLMRLLRALFFLSATFNVTITARHIPGDQNTSADALSRNNMNTFHSLNPQASPQPTQVPDALRQLVLDHSLRWTSPTWTRLFRSTLGTVLPPPPERHMPLSSVATWPSAPQCLVHKRSQ